MSFPAAARLWNENSLLAVLRFLFFSHRFPSHVHLSGEMWLRWKYRAFRKFGISGSSEAVHLRERQTLLGNVAGAKLQGGGKEEVSTIAFAAAGSNKLLFLHWDPLGSIRFLCALSIGDAMRGLDADHDPIYEDRPLRVMPAMTP